MLNKKFQNWLGIGSYSKKTKARLNNAIRPKSIQRYFQSNILSNSQEEIVSKLQEFDKNYLRKIHCIQIPFSLIFYSTEDFKLQQDKKSFLFKKNWLLRIQLNREFRLEAWGKIKVIETLRIQSRNIVGNLCLLVWEKFFLDKLDQFFLSRYNNLAENQINSTSHKIKNKAGLIFKTSFIAMVPIEIPYTFFEKYPIPEKIPFRSNGSDTQEKYIEGVAVIYSPLEVVHELPGGLVYADYVSEGFPVSMELFLKTYTVNKDSVFFPGEYLSSYLLTQPESFFELEKKWRSNHFVNSNEAFQFKLKNQCLTFQLEDRRYQYFIETEVNLSVEKTMNLPITRNLKSKTYKLKNNDSLKTGYFFTKTEYHPRSYLY